LLIMPRKGFTTIEVIVALTIMVILLALIVPQVVNEVRDAGTSSVVSALTTVADGASSHKADVRRYPGQLVFLTDTATTTPVDICGTTIPAVLRRRWSGPYLQAHVPTTGLVAGDATLLNALEYDNSGAPTNLVIVAIGVDQLSADDIEAQFDGDADFADGTIRWVTGGGTGIDTLRYYMPISGC